MADKKDFMKMQKDLKEEQLCDNEFPNDNEDFFATGDLLSEDDPERTKPNNHHLLSLMNGFKLTD